MNIDRGGQVTYNTDGKGRWWKRKSAWRCPEKIFMKREQCQGVEGHDGVHWCYDVDGSFCWDDNEYDPKEGGSSGSTPPDHTSYVSPQEMTKHCYRNNGTEYIEITDPDEIAACEANEDLSVIRPVTDPEMLEFVQESIEANEKAAEEFNKGKPRPNLSRRIGQILLNMGYLNDDQLWDILEEQKESGELFGQVAVKLGFITDQQIAEALAEQWGTPKEL